jgi:import inner membrane translocase subunit TIM50
LFRESTRFVDGKAVKDLSYLNRDLSKVVMLDTKSDHVALQPENAIIMKPWDGKAGDKGLVEMIPFLESIGIYAPADVRPVLQNYAGKDIPREYAKVEAAAKEAAIREWEARNPTAAGGGSFLSGIFGGSAAVSCLTHPW